MASTTNVYGPAPRFPPDLGKPVILNTAASTLYTFNKSTLAATGTPTNPFTALDGTASNHANVIRVPVLLGANYVDLFHEWTGTDPTTRPKVRVFGRFPFRDSDATNPTTATWPSDVNTSMGSPGTTRDSYDWLPLATDDGTTLIELGNAIDPVPFTNGTSKRSASTTVRTRGALEVIVLIDTISVANTLGLVAGTFGS